MRLSVVSGVRERIREMKFGRLESTEPVAPVIPIYDVNIEDLINIQFTYMEKSRNSYFRDDVDKGVCDRDQEGDPRV